MIGLGFADLLSVWHEYCREVTAPSGRTERVLVQIGLPGQELSLDGRTILTTQSLMYAAIDTEFAEGVVVQLEEGEFILGDSQPSPINGYIAFTLTQEE